MSDNYRLDAPEDELYACIDLKSFYASVECVERGLDPFTANLVVADPDREGATICLAITPAMKALGIRNRCRVYEIPKGVEYIMAKPRMRLYIERSAEIFSIYLRYVSHDDVHVYSIDECFIYLTPYLKLYKTDAKSLVKRMTAEVFRDTGICATAGIGTNLFLAKVALDIVAKRSSDFIGYLDRRTYLDTVAYHRPITDIWNVGAGIAARLSHYGVYDMSGVARLPEDTLYREFGINAEYLIDHAWGYEPCRISDIKAYKPRATSLTNSQVLFCPYSFDEARIILIEMVEVSTLELIARGLATDSISLSVGYNAAWDRDKRICPPSTAGSMRLGECTNSLSSLNGYFLGLYQRVAMPDTPIRNVAIGFGNLVDERYITTDLFTDIAAKERERSLLRAVVDIKQRFGKNSILRGVSFEEKATTRARNMMIGGHNGG